jgi:hypothetical protein
MVHWAGEGSDVILCLARDSPRLAAAASMRPSSVYISYDYGNKFENKTEHFRLEGKGFPYALLEKFFIHPKYNSHVSKIIYMMIMYGSYYVVESGIFELSVNFRTYFLSFSVRAVADIAILSLMQLDSIMGIYHLFMCRMQAILMCL